VILVDTSVLSSAFRRRRPGPGELRVQAACAALMASDVPLGLPGIVLQEVLSGISSEEQFDDLREKLLNAFTVVVASAGDHIEAARLRNRCRARGINVSGVDCLIAVAAIAGDHQLFTIDGDFAHIARQSALKLLSIDSMQ
jgi:predicted nucleic acid-binding protein